MRRVQVQKRSRPERPEPDLLKEQHLSLWSWRGSLKKAVDRDYVGFINALRRFEGLEEI